MEDLVRIVVVPLVVMAVGAAFEWVAVRVAGVRNEEDDGRFKVWLREPLKVSSKLHWSFATIRTYLEGKTNGTLLDIVELPPKKGWASSVSFDVCVAALTTDAVALVVLCGKPVPWSLGPWTSDVWGGIVVILVFKSVVALLLLTDILRRSNGAEPAAVVVAREDVAAAAAAQSTEGKAAAQPQGDAEPAHVGKDNTADTRQTNGEADEQQRTKKWWRVPGQWIIGRRLVREWILSASGQQALIMLGMGFISLACSFVLLWEVL